MTHTYIHDLPADEQESREVWAFEPHTFDDDGYPAKCRQYDVPLTSGIVETRRGHGTTVCPTCSQAVAVVSLNG